MIKTGVVGGTGYTGVELLRLLAVHPRADLGVITSRAEAGVAVADLFPNLRGHVDLKFASPDVDKLKDCEVVFFATPNGIAMDLAPELIEAGVRVIDLAADFRLKDPSEWERWYGKPHTSPELLQEAVYGLPEINREAIKPARLVANPGCYPTAVQLGLMPLVERHVVDVTRLIVDAKSGVSGAGRKAQQNTLLCEAGENFKAYAVPGHRHRPEIKQCLSALAGEEISLVFVPHLVPMIRGIHATIYAVVEDPNLDLQLLYRERYAAEPFIDVLDPGSHPETRNVRASNMCQIAVHRPQNGNMVVILSVIDNLVKGAAGQAVQNMNIMFGLDETMGLGQLAVLP